MFYKQIAKRKIGILLTVCLAIVFAYIYANIYNPMIIRRGGDEAVVRIENNQSVEQNIFLQNTKSIHVPILKETMVIFNSTIDKEKINLCNKSQIKFSLVQDNESQSIYYSVMELDDRWQEVNLDFDFNRYHNGEAILRVEGEDLNEYAMAAILLTSGQQVLDFDYAKSNGETVDEKYLSLSYMYFDYVAFWVIVCVALIIGVLVFFLSNVIKNICIKTPILFIAAIVVILEFVKNHVWNKPLDWWMTTPYLLNYNFGFISKALPGEIYSWFTNYVKANIIKNVFFVEYFVLIAVMFFVIYVCIYDKKRKSKEREVLSVFFAYYIVSPFFIDFYYNQWGRMDVILISLFLISGLIILKSKAFFYYFIFIISVIAILCHQIYVFVFYPAIFMMMLYRIIVFEEKDKIVPWILNLMIPAAIGFYVQFLGGLSIEYGDFIKVLSEKTDLPVLDAMILAEYYMPVKENIYTYAKVDAALSMRPLSLVIGLGLLYPVLKILICYWKSTINLQSQKYGKILIFVSALIPFASLPMFFTISDYGRVVQMVVIETIFMIAFLCKIDSNIFLQSAIKIYDDLNTKYGKMHVMIILVYLMFLGYNNVGAVVGDISAVLNTLFSTVYNVLFL